MTAGASGDPTSGESIEFDGLRQRIQRSSFTLSQSLRVVVVKQERRPTKSPAARVERLR